MLPFLLPHKHPPCKCSPLSEAVRWWKRKVSVSTCEQMELFSQRRIRMCKVSSRDVNAKRALNGDDKLFESTGIFSFYLLLHFPTPTKRIFCTEKTKALTFLTDNKFHRGDCMSILLAIGKATFHVNKYLNIDRDQFSCRRRHRPTYGTAEPCLTSTELDGGSQEKTSALFGQ